MALRSQALRRCRHTAGGPTLSAPRNIHYPSVLDVHVTLVDRRHTASGHWQDAYPFVQLHQASLVYGVASTVLGSGTVQQRGPEAGLQERARQSEIQAYYDDVLHRRFIGSGRVTFLGASEYHTDGSAHLVTSRVSGEILGA